MRWAPWATGPARRPVGWLIGAALGGLLTQRVLAQRRLRRRVRGHLAQFTAVPDLDTYEESRARVSGGSPDAGRPRQAVLLLHGYSGSPQEFGALLPALATVGLPYYAPLLTGFGLTDYRLLERVRAADWLRDALTAFDLLAALADTVSVVGQSTGGTLAVYLAQHRPVRHLVLVGPNLAPSAADQKWKTLLGAPLLGRLLLLAAPGFAKPIRPGRVSFSDTCDPDAARRAFSYAALPTHSLREQWRLQDCVDCRHMLAQSITLLLGARDLTVDVDRLGALLDASGHPYTRRLLSRSGHNVFQDYDQDEAAAAVVAALTRDSEPAKGRALDSTG